MPIDPLAHPNEARPARRSWQRVLFWSLAILGAVLLTTGMYAWSIAERIQRVDPTERDGFRSPYYFYVSDGAEERAEHDETLFFLVLPNNTGRADDDFEVHRRKAYTRLLRDSALARELKVLRKDLYVWRDRFRSGGPEALRGRGRPPKATPASVVRSTPTIQTCRERW